MYRWMLGIFLLYPLFVISGQTRPFASETIASGLTIPVLSIDGAIGPAVADYLIREIELINIENLAPLIILTIDTPGGLSSSLRDIDQSILNSNIPIVGFVYPQGSRAASAGTYILYACHFAAMAPTTTLGAATPVAIGGPLFGGESEKEEGPKEPTAMEKKVMNDSIAYIRSLAQQRNRNAEWAELAVVEAATLTAQEALEKNVINFIADTPEQLIVELDGKSININNSEITLDLNGAKLSYHQPDWRSQFIATITDPNIAYILMLVGVYGLALEFYGAGQGIAGLTGAIALLIALYAFQLLPLNYVGLGLIILGLSLMVVESIMPSFGLFGFGGIVAFILGSIFLFDTDQAAFRVSVTLISSIAILSASFFIFVLRRLLLLRKVKIITGLDSLIGEKAKVLESHQGQPFVLVNGERWSARCEDSLTLGQLVTVVGVDGLTLRVSQN